MGGVGGGGLFEKNNKCEEKTKNKGICKEFFLKGALESQAPPPIPSICRIMKNIQIRFFLQKLKN